MDKSNKLKKLLYCELFKYFDYESANADTTKNQLYVEGDNLRLLAFLQSPNKTRRNNTHQIFDVLRIIPREKQRFFEQYNIGKIDK